MVSMIRPILLGAGLSAGLVPGVAPGAAGPSRPVTAAVQLLADVTLIDAQCRGVAVFFGSAFRIAAAQGLDVADVMPGSRLRRLFEAAMARRAAATSREELCGALATDYAAAMPDLMSRP